MKNKVSATDIEARKEFEKYKKLIRWLRRGGNEKADNKKANNSISSRE